MGDTPAAPDNQGATVPDERASIGNLDDLLRQGPISNEDLSTVAKSAYEQLIEGAGGQEQALASLDALGQSGALSQGFATKLREAMVTANGDSNRFAQLVVDNKDSLAQLAILQATNQPGTNGPNSSPFGQMDLAQLFGGKDSDFFKAINDLIKGLTGGQFSLDKMFENMNNPGQPGAPETRVTQDNQTPAGGAPERVETGAETGGVEVSTAPVVSDQPVNLSVTGISPTSFDLSSGYTGLNGGNFGLGGSNLGYTGLNFDWDFDLNNDPSALSFSPNLGLNTPLSYNAFSLTDDQQSPSIFRTSFRDNPGFSFDTTPRVNLLSGEMAINGMSPTNRFGMLSNPDPYRISLVDPTLDLTTPQLGETFDSTADNTFKLPGVGGN